MTQAKVVVIYTDGGCEPNPGVGGWAAILLFGKKRRELSGGEQDTTNNRMELTAAIEALDALKRPCEVTLYTDSQYVKNGITQWIENWKRKGWKGSRNAEVKNSDLWRRLDQSASRHRVDWQWVRGHVGVEENERCDELAGLEIARLRALE